MPKVNLSIVSICKWLISAPFIYRVTFMPRGIISSKRVSIYHPDRPEKFNPVRILKAVQLGYAVLILTGKRNGKIYLTPKGVQMLKEAGKNTEGAIVKNDDDDGK